MNKKRVIVLGSILIAVLGAAAFATLAIPTQEASAESDPRQMPPIVRLTKAVPMDDAELSFTGIIAARVQSDLGFRVSGKIEERFVNTGQKISVGQPLMRIDKTDLQLALIAKRNAVAAARAVLMQARADEKRYATLSDNGLAASSQRYEQAKAALDTAEAQLAVAEAEAQLAENQASYSTLVADADGIVIETVGEPGQVVAAGQPVIRIAQTGPREALIALPETIRPDIGSVAEARVYGTEARSHSAHLRQLSDSADPRTRTYEARYVLGGEAATAPLGATVTIRVARRTGQPTIQVPLGALLDDGTKTGVWMLDRATSTVHFRPVKLVRLTSEHAVVSGLEPGEPIVSLGAHLLQEGTSVRPETESGDN
ncbi:efflux RND transporter periplasmic adaptor subunit [Roseovarius sp. 217]|uniref:efflux RND transporter periplasmic adaptor subunit n=1 Tax=Roseovarius sp. (strain 217) TaxID=314264 RepID=UPI000317B0DF|nr:efflux RND transporter periplasmic adaptor subunit [Roseovarius sp. 217]